MSAHRERLNRLLAESTPGEQESVLEEISADLRGFLREFADWSKGRKPSFRNIKSDRRYTWTNHTGNQIVQPLQFLTPKSLPEIVQIIRTAEAKGCKVRAIGSGHSFSDIVQVTDVLINTDELGTPIQLETDLLKDGVDPSKLVQVEAGMKIHALNEYLDRRGLALPNMGGYDAQSIVGAGSTSTHGSGITLGPLSSLYRSIILASNGGSIYRVEPAGGITDPVKHARRFPGTTLIQDDAWFHTVAVSMGCTGIIYSVTLEVMPKYWLNETRTMSDWVEVKKALLERRVLEENRHYEVLVNPYAIHGKHPCLVTRRSIVDRPSGLPPDKLERNFLAQLLGLIPGMVYILDFLFDTFPGLSPCIIHEAMKGLVDDTYVDVSYKVLNLGTPNRVSAYSMEIGFPVKDHVYLRAVERMFEVAARAKELGNIYHTSPISLRFVKASDAYLSMMYGQDTCMIELPVVNGTHGGQTLLQMHAEAMVEFDGRPHWGQLNWLPGRKDRISELYPEFATWLSVYRKLNAKGTFNNQFTDRCGISVMSERPG
jgi:hypothetical protein